ncbi:Ppx/GppA family phosphatase [Granulicatella seriolae]|uniref:Ppx/GppA family phosphatase n=1 Tax=Granulicatella seriolae TaxID=2967226 RepID=A0ABT1WNE0_9LACT|nr:Ppx/GppA family phosphatase [Granulicatella seriolae]
MTVLEKVGIIDIGSNTIRLVIFEIDENYQYREIQNIKTPARLFQYLDADKVLSPEGIQNLSDILSSFSVVLKEYKVETVIPVATAAIRQSTNQKEIVKTIKKNTGIKLQVFSEEEEAFYGQYAVAHTISYVDGITVDIGGGSTEITYFKNKKIENYISLPFGVGTLKQLFLQDTEFNNKNALEKMDAFIKKELNKISWIKNKELPIIAIGGSARNIGYVHQRLTNYPIAGIHGYRMKKADLKLTLDTFKSSSMKQLQELDGLSRDRWDIIIPANLVFLNLFSVVNAPIFLFSNQGLRQGILLNHINKTYNNPYSLQHIDQESVMQMANTYFIRKSVSQQRQKLTLNLLDQLTKLDLFFLDDHYRKFIGYGAYLYYLGAYVEVDASSQHTFYIISNSNLNGISHRDRVVLALLASYKNKSLFKQYTANLPGWFTDVELDKILAACGLIKFCEALNDSKLDTVESLQLEKIASNKQTEKNGYRLTVFHKGDIIAEDYRSQRQKKHLEKVVGSKVDIVFEAK